jgi:20S proteasome subunit alpha 5
MSHTTSRHVQEE